MKEKITVNFEQFSGSKSLQVKDKQKMSTAFIVMLTESLLSELENRLKQTETLKDAIKNLVKN